MFYKYSALLKTLKLSLNMYVYMAWGIVSNIACLCKGFRAYHCDNCETICKMQKAFLWPLSLCKPKFSQYTNLLAWCIHFHYSSHFPSYTEDKLSLATLLSKAVNTLWLGVGSWWVAVLICFLKLQFAQNTPKVDQNQPEFLFLGPWFAT